MQKPALWTAGITQNCLPLRAIKINKIGKVAN